MNMSAYGEDAQRPRVGHVHLKVKDLEVSRAFYCDLLGLKVSEEIPRQFLFLTFGSAHHDVALQAVGALAPSPPRRAVGLYHVAFEFPDEQAFRAMVENVQAAGYEPALVDHGISWAAYLSDPDGNGVELYLDRRHAAAGTPEWGGRSAALSL